MFHFDFPKFTALDFSIGVFDFQNEIDTDLTHVTASVMGGQQYSRPGHSDKASETKRVFSEEAASTPSEQSHRLLS